MNKSMPEKKPEMKQSYCVLWRRLWCRETLRTVVIGCAGLVGLYLLSGALLPVSRSLLVEKVGFSFAIHDRNGKLLRRGLSTRGFYYSHAPLSHIPPLIVQALIMTEDRRFYRHAGVDLLSLAGALLRNLRAGRVLSGGSTITMQIARNVYNLPRTLPAKLFEIWLAMRLENSFSKQELLEIYFNTIPFGKQLLGLGMAARVYFNKGLEELSPAQGAFLVALAKYPSFLYHSGMEQLVRRRQRTILRRLARAGVLESATLQRALTEELHVRRPDPAWFAPHFSDFLLARLRLRYGDVLHRISTVQTTLDYGVQKTAYRVARATVHRLRRKQISNAAVVILDVDDGELLAMVGGVSYFSDPESGQVNGAIALRPPGSTLKPFTYATAVDDRVMTPATVIPDIPTYIPAGKGDFVPINYNRAFNGPISMRRALACSYNVSAARTIRRATVERVLANLRRCGFHSLKDTSAYYGISLTLGGADVTLYDLTQAYLTLASQGVFRPVRCISEVRDATGKDLTKKDTRENRRVFSEQAVYLISDILSDNRAREDAFTLLSPLNMPFYCAAKTGTSTGFRNNWTIGYSRRFVTGVWVGNHDNRPMDGVSGISGAGTIFRSVMLALDQDYDFRPQRPEGIRTRIICPLSGKLARPFCSARVSEEFIAGTEPLAPCDVHFRIPYDRTSDQVVFVGSNQRAKGRFKWRIQTVLPSLYNRWLEENGQPLPSPRVLRYVRWLRGEYKPDKEQPRILFPDQGDEFVVDPILNRSHQVLTFRASLPAETRRVRWRLNDRMYVARHYPFSLDWKIRPGSYRLLVEAELVNGERQQSEAVSFSVKQ